MPVHARLGHTGTGGRDLEDGSVVVRLWRDFANNITVALSETEIALRSTIAGNEVVHRSALHPSARCGSGLSRETNVIRLLMSTDGSAYSEVSTATVNYETPAMLITFGSVAMAANTSATFDMLNVP